MKADQLPLESVRELSRHMSVPGADPRLALLAALKVWPKAGAIRSRDGSILDLILPLSNRPRRG